MLRALLDVFVGRFCSAADLSDGVCLIHLQKIEINYRSFRDDELRYSVSSNLGTREDRRQLHDL